MPTIYAYARNNFRDTYDALVEKYPESATGAGDDVMTLTLSRVMAETFLPTVDEGDLVETVKAYVGDLVTLFLIPAGIDLWSKGTLSKGVRNEAVSFYDRVKALREVELRIQLRIKSNSALVSTLAGAQLLSGSSLRASSLPRVSVPLPFKTLDPVEMPAQNVDV